MTEAIINFFRDLIGNDFITVIIIAFIPIIELRGAIPVGIEMGMAWWQSFGLAFIGSCIAIPILLLLLKPILNLLKKIKFFNRFATTIEEMFSGKAAKIAAKAGTGGDVKRKELWIKLIGVFTFVALPIPLTGVWTGTAIAVFLGLPFFKSLITVMLGNLVAGTIVTLLSVFFKQYLDTILMVFFILVIVIVVFYIFMIGFKMYKSKKSEMSKVGGLTARELEIQQEIDPNNTNNGGNNSDNNKKTGEIDNNIGTNSDTDANVKDPEDEV